MVKKRKQRPSSAASKRPNAIPRASFDRLVKEISEDVRMSDHPLKWSRESIDGLQEETEAYVAMHFGKANRLLDAFEQRTLGLRHFRSARA